ncbi:MAG: hypothetical protein H7330_05080, partial [Hymenobacteraceae bacterium]|nr:hypothetical protein [Hymenobacteraceae bacterium]
PAPPDGIAPAADAAAAPGTAPSGIDAALGAEKSATRSTAIKPITTQPKLNPNSSGVYDKKVVKNQNKHTEKIVRKRRNVTARYADIRRGEQINGIRRMEKGKISTSSRNR